MTIDKSGLWWVGTDAADLREHLAAYLEASDPLHEFRSSICPCGSDVFQLHLDDTEGAARRTCAHCRRQHFIGDSKEYWSEASPEQWRCTQCGSEQANVGVGYELNDEGDVRWMYVCLRCVACGVLCSPVDWEVNYGPSRHLLDLA